LRILHVVPSYLPATRYGGPIYSVHGLARGLVQNGHDVHVMTTNVDGPSISNVPVGRPVDIDGVKVTYFPVGFPRRIYRSANLARALNENIHSFDVLHLHSVFLWPTWAAARIAVRAKVPYVLAPRGMLVKELVRRRSRLVKAAWIALVDRRTVRQAAAVHVTSDVEAADLQPFGFDLPAIINLPNGVDMPSKALYTEPSDDIAAVTAGGPFVLAFGRINWKKNLAVLISAVPSVPNMRLVIAGTPEDGHDYELTALTRSLGITDRVSIIGRDVQGPDKDALFRHCAIFALTSFSENFGNVILEAMSFGKPVVASRGAGASKIIDAKACGLSVDPTESSIAQALDHLIRNTAEALAMGARGRAAAKHEFSWRSIAKAMDRYYAALRCS
jgi:glycosyltransferase involved in cell wall biosynthesis